MVTNKPMKGPVKEREEILCYLSKPLNSLVIFHTKILHDALNTVLKHHATHSIQGFISLFSWKKIYCLTNLT